MAPSCTQEAHRIHGSLEAQDAEDSSEVVRQYVQAHFGRHVLEASSQEVRPTHPVLERSEDVLDGALSHRHRVRHAVQPLLGLVHDTLVLPSPDAPVPTRGALRLH